MSWVSDEKAALVATLRGADPQAPTLDEGWDVRRLLAHLVQREQGPVASVVDAVSRRPPGEEPGLSRLVDGASTPEGYAALVGRFEAGPPRWSPMSWAGEKLNLGEYVIHHEDIRRAGPVPAEPRTLPEGQQQAVWRQLTLFALTLRSAPVGVRLATPTGTTRVAKKGDGVTLTGEPVELALYLSGRRPPARVAVTGDPDAITSFTGWVGAR
jgi:uncharacterized protein (TIGR03085 family)